MEKYLNHIDYEYVQKYANSISNLIDENEALKLYEEMKTSLPSKDKSDENVLSALKSLRSILETKNMAKDISFQKNEMEVTLIVLNKTKNEIKEILRTLSQKI